MLATKLAGVFLEVSTNHIMPGGKKILVVDDDPIVRAMLQETLERSAYDVQIAASGRKALELVSRARPDLVLLDIEMPELDGREVLKRLRASDETKRLPVIILTGNALDQESVIELLQLDPDEILTKIISAKELIARIEWVLRRYC